MADFKQAVKWMKEGKKVRISTWVIPEYIQMHKNQIELINPDFDVIDWMSMVQYEATNWEIYKEEESSADFLLRLGTDGQKWAQEFMLKFADKEIDEDLLIGWFANAIEAGRAAGYESGLEDGAW